jgi:hypothetical protein
VPIFDLFSKRQKRLRGETPDVFTYDELPRPLKVQIVHIWKDALGEDSQYFDEPSEVYKAINEILCREYGVFKLNEDSYSTWAGEISRFFMACTDIEKAIDVIEIVFHAIDNVARDSGYAHQANCKMTPDEAIEELNSRFLEHGVGYHFESGQIIRKDSELLHVDVVKPVLIFLNQPEYRGANEEFLKAHQHYSHGRYKESLNECLKAFESTMKAICHKRGWAFNQNDTAKKLIEVCLANGIVPNYLQTQITALKSVLESGIPTVRNKLGGHGQGTQQTSVPRHLVSYMLHITASTILMMTEAEKSLP